MPRLCSDTTVIFPNGEAAIYEHKTGNKSVNQHFKNVRISYSHHINIISRKCIQWKLNVAHGSIHLYIITAKYKRISETNHGILVKQASQAIIAQKLCKRGVATMNKTGNTLTTLFYYSCNSSKL